MKGYGIYKDDKLIAWFDGEDMTLAEIPDYARYPMYTIKPTEGNFSPIQVDPIRTIEGVYKAYGLKTLDPATHACRFKQGNKCLLGSDYSTCDITKPSGCAIRINYKYQYRKYWGETHPGQYLKEGACAEGSICNGCDYSTSKGDCILASEANNSKTTGHNKSIRETKSLTLEQRQNWLKANPLRRFMNLNKIGFLALTKRLDKHISATRLQSFCIGAVEPREAEFKLITLELNVDYNTFVDQWYDWYESV